jgi:hypothetical protein
MTRILATTVIDLGATSLEAIGPAADLAARGARGLLAKGQASLSDGGYAAGVGSLRLKLPVRCSYSNGPHARQST